MTGPDADPDLDDGAVRDALAVAADALARRLGLHDDDRARLATRIPLLGPLRSRVPAGASTDDAPPPGAGEGREVDVEVEGDPASLGRLHQSLLDREHRHRRGVHYTPSAVAALLVGLALPESSPAADARSASPALPGPSPAPPRVCDPSCGGGVFLLAAAQHLRTAGHHPEAAVRAQHGVDLDPLAVEVTRAALLLWASTGGVGGAALSDLADVVLRQVVVGDGLRDRWPGERTLDVVVGNPPFGGQLSRSTARDPEAAAAARDLLGGAAAGYADTAGLFLVRATGAVVPGGRVTLLQPLSFLAARDAGAVRRRLREVAVLEEVWLADERLFGASVDVCAPVLTVAPPFSVPEPAREVRVRRGATGDVTATVGSERLARAGSWAPIVAAATGVPEVDLGGRPPLGSWARSTAGFRDEFYALAPFVVDLAPSGDGLAGADQPLPTVPAGHAVLVTAGLVEPARTLWGRRATRLAGRRLTAPAVDLVALRASSEGPDGDRRLAAWADARVRPKVVVATQTRVVEAAVDDDGTWWPSVPVISVVLDPERDDEEHRWLVAAALTSPPASAWAAERSGGTALAPQAIKLSARQVLEVPLPVDREAWVEGARLLRSVAHAVDEADRSVRLAAAGRALTAAHDLAPEPAAAVLRWWAARAGCATEI